MSRMMFSNDNINGKYIEFFIGLYNRNKKLLILSAGIYFLSLVIGVIMGYFLLNTIGYFLTIVINRLREMTIEINTTSIFLHNLTSIFITYVGGIIGIIPAGMVFENGFLYGSFVGYFMHGGILNNYGVSNPLNFIIYTLPHGIFEIPGLIISGTAGFRLASMIISFMGNIGKNTPIKNYWKLKDSLALFIIGIILTFIAAIIEANFSLSIGNHITGLNLL
jgi:Uncharacterized membrane protein